MRASYYAQAFHELATAKKMDEGKLVKQFVETVAGNGHAHLFPKIVRSLERIEKRKEEAQTIEVTSAKELSPMSVAQLLKRDHFKKALSPEHKKVVRKIDDTLIGGEIVRAGSLKIDASYKRTLVELYQSLISS